MSTRRWNFGEDIIVEGEDICVGGAGRCFHFNWAVRGDLIFSNSLTCSYLSSKEQRLLALAASPYLQDKFPFDTQEWSQ